MNSPKSRARFGLSGSACTNYRKALAGMIATHVHAGRLCIKGERDKDGYLLDLYGVYWVAYDTPPGEKEDKQT